MCFLVLRNALVLRSFWNAFWKLSVTARNVTENVKLAKSDQCFSHFLASLTELGSSLICQRGPIRLRGIGVSCSSVSNFPTFFLIFNVLSLTWFHDQNLTVWTIIQLNPVFWLKIATNGLAETYVSFQDLTPLWWKDSMAVPDSFQMSQH